MRRGGGRVGVVAAALLVLLALPAPSTAQGLRSVSVSLDNDGLAFWIPPSRRSDWYYTHGTRVELVGGWTVPGMGALGLRELAPCGPGTGDGPCRLTRLRFVQRIYTPRNLFFYNPFRPPESSDRPYAGWLGARVSVERVSDTGSRRISLELGVTGAPSLARELHLTIHEMLGKEPPRGWEYELPFELAGAVSWREAGRLAAATSPGGLSVALEPHWQATLGTLRTSAGVGASLRAGWNATGFVGPAGAASPGPWLQARVGVEAEAVARDLFIEGSWWQDSARASKEPLLGRARARLVVGWGRTGLELGVTRTTPAFSTQDEGHTFATVGLRVR